MGRLGRKLYLQLYLAFLGLLVVSIAVSLGVSFALGRGSLEVWSRGPRIARHLARSLPSPLERGELQRALEDASEELGLDLAVIGDHGEILGAAGRPISPPAPGGLSRAQHFANWIEPGLVGAPLRHAGAPRSVLLVRIPLPPGARHVLPLRPILSLLGVLLVSAALLYPFSRTITRPLEKLTAAAEAFGRGDLSARSGIAAPDEVGRLARSFDEMAARIETARRAEKELLANVSHELRTPLARMKIALELIDPRGDASVASRLAALDEEIDELDRLVGDVLTASRLDLAELPLRKARLPVRELLETSRRRALALSPEPAIEIDGSDGLVLEVDPALASRALDNLIENARKHGGMPGPIAVAARRDGPFVVLAVRDRGPGFHPDELPRVFDPFFRGSEARGRTSGYGLGLALVRRVAEAHGGSIAARNCDDGGACLELRLPAAA